MTAIDIINGMHPCVVLLSSLEEQKQACLKPGATFRKTVSLGYDTITLTLDIITSEGGKSATGLFMQCALSIQHQNVKINRVYCENKAREQHVHDYIRLHAPEQFPGTPGTSAYNAETLRYITIADAIAKEAYQCSSGDNYHPGHFSEIIIDNDNITLRQINRHNSRSIDHKDDYHLRDLEFFIPRSSATPKSSFHDEHIGNMVIRFSDTSSKKNKKGGDKIRKKLDEEKLKFESV